MELLSIADFAEKAGVTPQAIYKRLKTDLEPFLVIENGFKFVKEDALELFNHSQAIKQASKEKELQERIEELESLVDTLTQEKIELLTKANENSEKLWTLTEKLTQMQENFQVLLAQTNQVVLSLNKPTETEVEESTEVEAVELNFNETEVEATTTVEEVELNSNKPSFFKRIFKRP